MTCIYCSFSGPFEKFTRITMILPLTGKIYSEKVAENCEAIWKSLGIYTETEEKALEKFLQVFKDQNLLPGSSVLFTQSPSGSLTVSKLSVILKITFCYFLLLLLSARFCKEVKFTLLTS